MLIRLLCVIVLLFGCDSSVTKKINHTEYKEASSSNTIVGKIKNKCADDMVYVHGEYCLDPKHICLEWMEDPNKYPYARCRVYDANIKCKKDKSYMQFCIDKLEASDDVSMPIPDVSWTQAKLACEKQNKRLCTEKEWTFACEGEQMLPYPYGLVRDSTKCNFEIYDGLVNSKGNLADHRVPVNSKPKCISPFGVMNMVGNIDEWVVLDKPHYSQKNKGRKMMSGLKGGWWGPLRNRCRPTTVDHDEHFHEFQTGYRCCKNSEDLIE